MQAGSMSARCVRGVRGAWLVAVVLSLPPTGGADSYRARPLATFEHRGPAPLRLPTAVAVAGDGRVYVADGVNDRIVIFDPDGSPVGELREVAGQALRQPLSVRVDARGRVWIADTGNQRVAATAGDGAEEVSLPGPVASVPSSTAPTGSPATRSHRVHPLDFTDVLPLGDGTRVWVVDNDHHRLALVDVPSGTWSFVGQEGEALGQFRFPFMMAQGPGGELLVTDVLNARVAVLTADGAPAGRLGQYGVEPGELYRPKGVALHADGSVWVSDSVLGVVQAFSPAGESLDVLRDEQGEMWHFEHPLGIAFDGRGRLYVVETQAHRVRSFEVWRVASPPLPPPQPRVGTGRQGSSCTVCHLDWLADFEVGAGATIIPKPAESRDDPLVARSQTCLGCHDGSVVDSRRRVWEEHGHRTGVVPPESMKVPATLPLVRGRIACRTCHSAHVTGQPAGDIRTAVFLRVQNVASELCVGCHADKARGPRLGTHPTGGMPWPVPQNLIEAGARIGPNPRELTCQVCHTPHGARHEHLLVLGTESNQLCLSCHEPMRPGMFREGPHTEHPLHTARVSPEQRTAVNEMGTRLGPQGELICLSCHKLHHGRGERFLLADDLAEGRMCLRCHQDRRILEGTVHDLRTSRPQERNRLGMTAHSGGPCSACHLFHRYARELTPLGMDRSGKCTTCHQAGRCAEQKVLAGVNHPTIECVACHDPHEPRYGLFLRGPTREVCGSCHADQLSIAGGAHDATARPAFQGTSGPHARDPCLACHRPHGDEQRGLFRAGLAQGESAPDGACLACHPGSSWEAPGPAAALHPRAARPADSPAQAGMAPARPVAHAMEHLARDERQPGSDPVQVGCSTCHDPHAGPTSARPLLRGAPAGRPEQLCVTCHTAAAYVGATPHGRLSLQARPGPAGEPGACRPCHAVHGDPSQVSRRLLWPAALSGPAPADPTDVGDTFCVGCHRSNGAAAPPGAATHPDVALFDPLHGQSALPLYDAQGRPAASGRITCRTCHTPHGRLVAGPHGQDARDKVRQAVGEQIEDAGEGERTGSADRRPGTRPLLREFRAPNVCTTCHGVEALRRFLYFHDPLRRGVATGQ